MQQWQINYFAGFFRIVCGVRHIGSENFARGPKIFYANHTSHLDFIAIWSSLPHFERARVRPVAGRDYWIKSRARRFLASEIFNALLIERLQVTRKNNPISIMIEALNKGSSLIVFPEGTRGSGRKPELFKPGLYHLHKACPDVPLIPVYLQNLNCMLPKGTLLPIPLITHLDFGNPLQSLPESKDEFLETTRQAIIEFIKF